MKVLLFVLLLSVAFGLNVRSFQGSKVIRVFPTTLDHLAILQRMEDLLYDFWTDPIIGRSVDILIEPGQFKVIGSLEDAGMKVETFIHDVQALVDGQKAYNTKPNAFGADPYFNNYHPYDEVLQYVEGLAAKYPHLATTITIGKSYQGRDLRVLVIGANKTTTPVGAWYDGGLHAREWITTPTVLYMTAKLLENYGTDPEVTRLLDGMIIHVLPVHNPDGVVYTWGGDRMWRKTRAPNSGSSCVGTDPNRNWDFHWGGAGSSSNPCSDSYMGPKAFSSIEVETVAYYIKAQGNIRGYINFHSYSQLWMSPWGYTSDLPPDFKKQDGLSAAATAALKTLYGTTYQHGSIATTIYPAAGSSADWCYGVANVLYSYGVELRDTGRYGFLLPPEQIIPSGEETYLALKVFLQRTLDNV